MMYMSYVSFPVKYTAMYSLAYCGLQLLNYVQSGSMTFVTIHLRLRSFQTTFI